MHRSVTEEDPLSSYVEAVRKQTSTSQYSLLPHCSTENFMRPMNCIARTAKQTRFDSVGTSCPALHRARVRDCAGKASLLRATNDGWTAFYNRRSALTQIARADPSNTLSLGTSRDAFISLPMHGEAAIGRLGQREVSFSTGLFACLRHQ